MTIKTKFLFKQRYQESDHMFSDRNNHWMYTDGLVDQMNPGLNYRDSRNFTASRYGRTPGAYYDRSPLRGTHATREMDPAHTAMMGTFEDENEWGCAAGCNKCCIPSPPPEEQTNATAGVATTTQSRSGAPAPGEGHWSPGNWPPTGGGPDGIDSVFCGCGVCTDCYQRCGPCSRYCCGNCPPGCEACGGGPGPGDGGDDGGTPRDPGGRRWKRRRRRESGSGGGGTVPPYTPPDEPVTFLDWFAKCLLDYGVDGNWSDLDARRRARDLAMKQLRKIWKYMQECLWEAFTKFDPSKQWTREEIEDLLRGSDNQVLIHCAEYFIRGRRGNMANCFRALKDCVVGKWRDDHMHEAMACLAEAIGGWGDIYRHIRSLLGDVEDFADQFN